MPALSQLERMSRSMDSDVVEPYYASDLAIKTEEHFLIQVWQPVIILQALTIHAR